MFRRTSATVFYKLEKDLAIQDPKLRATRRLVQNWNDCSTQQQQLAATQIDRYFRQNGMRSDISPLFGQNMQKVTTLLQVQVE